MRLKDLIRALKHITAQHSGSRDKKMPASAFPMSRNRSFRPGLGWDWWAVEFDADGQRCRMLTTLNEGKQVFRAWLAVHTKEDLALVARIEHEPIHAGEWHCHLCCEDISAMSLGVVKQPPSVKTVRLAMGRHRKGFNVTYHSALEMALRFYKIEPKIPGGLFNVC